MLLLRSFADDRLTIRAHRTSRQSRFATIRATPSDRFEEILAWSLWKEGPVTALGQPGSRLPPLGATREYYLDGDWKQPVSDLIASSAIVVIVIDTTSSLEWEIAQVRAQGALHRTIFVVPPTRSRNSRARLRKLEQQLGLGRSLTRLSASTEVLAVRVWPGAEDWEIRAYVARFRDDLSYEVAIHRASQDIGDRSVPPRALPPNRLARPAPRGARPKARSGVGVGWVLAGISMLLTSSLGAILGAP